MGIYCLSNYRFYDSNCEKKMCKPSKMFYTLFACHMVFYTYLCGIKLDADDCYYYYNCTQKINLCEITVIYLYQTELSAVRTS